MSQTPRTPHARDNASLDPSQDADDAYGANDDLYGDENVDTDRTPEDVYFGRPWCHQIEQSSPVFVASGYVVIATLLTVLNTSILHDQRLVSAEILIFAQQLFAVNAFLLAHLLHVVQLDKPKTPTADFLLVVISFFLYVVSSMYAQSKVSLPLYVTLRKLQILSTVLLDYIMRGQVQSRITLASLLLITCGALVHSGSAARAEINEFVACIICNILGSMYTVALAKHKSANSMDSANVAFQCALYLSCLSGILAALRTDVFSGFGSLIQLYVMASVALAAMMNFAVIWNTRVNSPLAQSICSNIKDLTVLTVGCFINPLDLHTLEDILSVFLIFLGATVFSFQTYLRRIRIGNEKTNIKKCCLLFIVIGVCVLYVEKEFTFFGSFKYTKTIALTSPSEVSLLASPSSNAPFSNNSILAVVTLGLAKKYNFQFLSLILENYAHLCEIGFVVRVVLVTYVESEPQSIYYLQKLQPTCYSSKIEISIESFPLRPLPKTAFGTRGDLAIRHRDVFVREQDNYGYYLVQEDDVLYSAEVILYFIKYSHLFAKISTQLYPGFVDYEVMKGIRYADWRLNKGAIKRCGGELCFVSKFSAGGRGYILSQQQLKVKLNGLPNASAWLDPMLVKGEFNPTVASVRSSKFAVVYPLNDWDSGAIHHMSNKYIRMARGLKDNLGNYEQFLRIKFEDMCTIFASCLNESQKCRSHGTTSTIHFAGDCMQCVESKGFSRMTIRRNFSAVVANVVYDALQVNFDC
mmetsp:Transcript_2410/g.7934  ORF Transcript_2410/g.7934 Transcript_2410/m.7934 type:complete len:751 (-) Transcript_2410:313-2565(-)|eukprot:CAMPEP_0179692694 /NCGR_PEP_ID=MMETSP0936-20121108/4876_1 /TAXON_ID=548131 ORGANISM="Ostreococcus mediterraneus, Strain clade-D-RCC2573" /NCGR_SAMPLE_ID=MMETSP0936 /ASSEMBLY_ACC=CAM_ASM_000574 /LENGTH=750 /DNA_ID=CAMNT_0021565405 /DNA_START=354 /DNA_END=2606 /DNA_ORIENTATION=+